MSPTAKFLADFLPLCVFFIGYKYYDIFTGTLILIIASLISFAITYYYEKKIHKLQLFSLALVVVMGGITVLTKNPAFIKMKPTIVYLIFSVILLFGVYIRKQGYLRHIFGENAENFHEEFWMIISRRFSWFFMALAILNEFIWRNFHENLWVKFKVFGCTVLVILFIISQTPLIKKHMKS